MSAIQDCISDQIRKAEEDIQLNQAKRCLLQYIQEKIIPKLEGSPSFDIEKEWILSSKELNDLFLINLNKTETFNKILESCAKTYGYFFEDTAYYSLIKMLDSPWFLNDIIPLTIYYPFPPFKASEGVA